MEEALALIERIIEEHKVILRGVKNLEKVANDAEAMAGLEISKETFMPGRLEQKQSLQKMSEVLETIEKGIRAHFHFEETGLLSAIEKHGDSKLVSALNSLLPEHADLRQRLEHSRNHISELIDGGLSRHMWEASAHDMRAHISHTRKLLQGHVAGELPLLMALRKRLEGKTKGKD